MASLSEIPEGDLRAMADCRAISSARFVEEMERRACRATVDAPPLDYALDDELAVPFLHHDNFLGLDLSDFNDDPIGPMPPPPRVVWLVAIAATSVIAIALCMVWP
ncbi:hypothetical protein [Mesorhizobium sp. B2-3-6]|uniref:hypothetical protein n=1 Tax=Mesorhizobium sp. B2-3-6 TaxID=2589957 RepID=UPI001129146C|nr:hypothetical protein [Mesorhizobium sp. B2-3-6]TPM19811.1 hypothetical protein FJ953_15535 [Mesorhizobium sp. B2-3-6]